MDKTTRAIRLVFQLYKLTDQIVLTDWLAEKQRDLKIKIPEIDKELKIGTDHQIIVDECKFDERERLQLSFRVVSRFEGKNWEWSIDYPDFKASPHEPRIILRQGDQILYGLTIEWARLIEPIERASLKEGKDSTYRGMCNNSKVIFNVWSFIPFILLFFKLPKPDPPRTRLEGIAGQGRLRLLTPENLFANSGTYQLDAGECPTARDHPESTVDRKVDRERIVKLSLGCFDLVTLVDYILRSDAEVGALENSDWFQIATHSKLSDSERSEEVQRLAATKLFELPARTIVDLVASSCPLARKSGISFLTHCTPSLSTLISILKGGNFLQSGPAAAHFPGEGGLNAIGYGVYFDTITRDLVTREKGNPYKIPYDEPGKICLVIDPCALDRISGFRSHLRQKEGLSGRDQPHPDNRNWAIANSFHHTQYFYPEDIHEKRIEQVKPNTFYAMFRDKLDTKYVTDLWVDSESVSDVRQRLRDEGLSRFADMVKPKPSTYPEYEKH
jgi:hypothetical protein